MKEYTNENIKKKIEEIEWRGKNKWYLEKTFEEDFAKSYGEEKPKEMLDNFKQCLREGVEFFTELLSSLNEIKDNLDSNDYFYMLCTDKSEYCYIDKNYTPYELKEINDKLILVDKEYNLYEIIEAYDTDFLSRVNFIPYGNIRIRYSIDVVVKVKRIK